MKPQEIQERIEEYRRIRRKPDSDGPALAEAALFVEEVFGLLLSDAEISADNLGSIPAIKQFVLTKLELH